MRCFLRWIRAGWMVFCAVLCWGLAQGHQVETVEFEFQKSESAWRLLGEMDIAYMLPETRKVPGGQPLSREATMKAPPEELARIRRETEKTLRSLLRITYAGAEIPWRLEFPDFEKDPFELPEEAADWALLSTRIVIDPRPGPGALEIHWSGEEESELILLTEDSEDGEVVSVQPGGSLRLLEVAATGNVSKSGQQAFATWLWTGFRHVLPLGLDHMLFIVGLFLMVPKWKPLLQQSLIFTLAHSVTLALAVLGWVEVPSRPVEILIAFSIAFIGVENLLTQQVGKLRLALVLGFGLIHGLGFASVLAEKLEGVSKERLLMPLGGFNLGVEIAQITVLGLCFLILQPLRPWTPRVRIVGSVGVALAGLGWMVERIFLA